MRWERQPSWPWSPRAPDAPRGRRTRRTGNARPRRAYSACDDLIAGMWGELETFFDSCYQPHDGRGNYFWGIRIAWGWRAVQSELGDGIS